MKDWYRFTSNKALHTINDACKVRWLWICRKWWCGWCLFTTSQSGVETALTSEVLLQLTCLYLLPDYRGEKRLQDAGSDLELFKHFKISLLSNLKFLLKRIYSFYLFENRIHEWMLMRLYFLTIWVSIIACTMLYVIITSVCKRNSTCVLNDFHS